MKRRGFLHKSAVSGLLMTLGNFPLNALAKPEIKKITILHTNDVHSRIDPFPMDGSRNKGMGGAARRASLVADIRRKEKNVLLLDAGDIFQGTPYFNFFDGALEIKLMSKMRYDAATIGNHDFDNGIEGLDDQLYLANFPFIISNYNFDDTVLADKTLDHKIFMKDGVKIGVFGLGIELDGLVAKKLYKDTQYYDPIKTAQKYATRLKKDLACDLVVCLSHLGYSYREDPHIISDVIIAEQTEGIDIIIGGHTHTFMSQPDIRTNKLGEQVIVNQAGWAGIMMGRIDIYFEENKKNLCLSCKNKYIN